MKKLWFFSFVILWVILIIELSAVGWVHYQNQLKQTIPRPTTPPSTTLNNDLNQDRSYIDNACSNIRTISEKYHSGLVTAFTNQVKYVGKIKEIDLNKGINPNTGLEYVYKLTLANDQDKVTFYYEKEAVDKIFVYRKDGDQLVAFDFTQLKPADQIEIDISSNNFNVTEIKIILIQ